jgi:hypothetical protein
MNAIKETIITAALVIGLCVFLGWSMYKIGNDAGVESEHMKWMGIESERRHKEIMLRDAHSKEIQSIIDKQFQTNLEVSISHENELEDLRLALAVAKSDSHKSGGLRVTIPARDCKASDTAGEADSESTSRHHEAATETVRIPDDVERSLWAIAERAEEVTAQCRAAQKWIVDNGFYGVPNDNNQQLLGKIDSNKNDLEVANGD